MVEALCQVDTDGRTACKNIYRPLSGAGLTYPMMEKEIRHLRAAAEVLLRMQKRGEQSEGVDLLDHDVVAFRMFIIYHHPLLGQPSEDC